MRKAQMIGRSWRKIRCESIFTILQSKSFHSKPYFSFKSKHQIQSELQMNAIAIELQSNQIKNQKDNRINDEQSFSKKHSMNKIKSGFALRGQKLRKPPDKFLPAISSIILTWLVIFCGRQFDLVKTWLTSTISSQEQEARTTWFASNISQEQELPSGTQNQILDNYPAPQHDT